MKGSMFLIPRLINLPKKRTLNRMRQAPTPMAGLAHRQTRTGVATLATNNDILSGR